MSMSLRTQVVWMLVDNVKDDVDVESLATRIIGEVRQAFVEEAAQSLAQVLRDGMLGPDEVRTS